MLMINKTEKDSLLQELREKFSAEKEILGFKATFEEIEEEFSLEYHILKEGFVSNRLMNQVSFRMIDKIESWAGYLRQLIMPAQSDIVNSIDNKLLSENEKKEIWELFKNCMSLSSKHSIIGLTNNKIEHSKFIDETLKFWKNKLKEKIVILLKRSSTEWSK